MKRAVAVVAVTICALLLIAAPAAAHPLGNFTANTYAGLRVSADATRIDYVLDLAEIPAFQTRQRIAADGEDRYRESECAAIAEGVTLAVGSRRATVRVESSKLTFPPGQAGLDTLRLECALLADTGRLDAVTELTYEDTTLRDRIGWREVTAVGDGTTLVAADVAVDSLSDRLRAYPDDRLASPLAQTTAALTVDPAAAGPADAGAPSAVAEGAPGIVGRLDSTLSGFVTRQDVTLGLAAAALGLAFLLGTLHALAPGHGKTVIAAYLVGRSGSFRDALRLGVTVAVTHTLGVLVLGAVLSLTQAFAPERLYPLLGIASGLLFAGVGVTLLPQAVASWRHGGHGHHHEHARSVGRSLIAPGLAGGMVPSPSALLVLLGGIALGRATFAVTLVLAYGLGMGAALIGAGYLLVRMRPDVSRLSRVLPLGAACLVVVGGLVLATRSALAV